MVKCSRCGCSWDETTGYYHCKGVIQQPCKECRLDAKSIRYLNNRDSILESQRNAYYEDHEASKEYYRLYRRSESAQATA